MGRPRIKGLYNAPHHVTLPDYLSDFIRKEAANNGTSVSAEIRRLVEKAYRNAYMREYNATRKLLGYQ